MATNNFFKGTNNKLLDPVEQTAENPSNTSNYPDGTIIWNRTTESFYKLDNGSWSVVSLSGSNIPLNDVSDVNTAGVTDGQALAYDASTSTWKPFTFSTGSASSLNNLSDVNVPGPSDNQILYYDSGTSAWRPQDFSVQETYSSASDLEADLGSLAAKSTVSTSDFTDFSGDVNSVTEVLDLNKQTSTSYTFALSDVGNLVSFDNTGSITATVPAVSSVDWDSLVSGTQSLVIGLIQGNSGSVTIASDPGVTVRSKDSHRTINGAWATAALTYLDTNSWLLSGNLITPSWFTAQSDYYDTVVPADADTDYFVDFDNGNNSNDGSSWAQAFATLDTAAALLDTVGGVIKVRGTFTGDGVSTNAVYLERDGTSGQHIEMWADTLHGATIDANGCDNAITHWGSYLDLNGFELHNAQYIGIRCYDGLGGAVHNYLRYLYVHDILWPDTNSGNGGAYINPNGPDSIVDSCLCIGSTPVGGDSFATTLHGIYIRGTDTIVRNNLVANIRAGRAIQAYNSSGTQYVDGFQAFNNTVINPSDAGIHTTATNSVIANNIVAYVGTNGIRYTSSATGTTTNNLFWQNTTNFLDSNGPNTNDNPITGDPDFVNFALDGSGDYRVTTTGNAFEAGSSTYAPTVDYYGNDFRTSPTVGFAEVDAG